MAGLYRLNELEQQIANDHDWALEAPEVQQHEGKWVVVHKKRVLAIGDDERQLRRDAAAKEGCPEVELVTVFVYEPGLWDIPH